MRIVGQERYVCEAGGVTAADTRRDGVIEYAVTHSSIAGEVGA
ncbi:hypothetical protein [Arthrobacter sp. SX1312]|nr:hypothetical protein [Arthrobacter sp. SX1312]